MYTIRSQVGIGSELHCLLVQLKRTLEILDSDAGRKAEKSGVLKEENVIIEML